ncbi:psbP domain-containing protein 5, chloroplastic isoform X2 [Nicotiana tomentosiformis]|uniref:psbP domain-containing protein 5, chloroplastic isoform X2 n=1 Tax=Nicotiana tomentosiformis TaxID=4098 RepID=UPI00051BA5EE|nr:psbP domain-containing protein 5, chloroplastic isoform X2 [Nicotiana tomentosiformis]
MATALLSSPPLPLSSSSNPSILPTRLKNQSKILWKQKKCGKIRACSEFCKEPALEYGILRRDLAFIALSSSLSLIFPLSGFSAEEELKMGSSVDDVNSYSYLYPIELPSKKFVFKWVETRKPERYSSAAPLSPDARLRIVSERVDIIDNLIISVSIGPPNSQFLKSKEKSTWSAKDVADSVLSDKSALIDGEPYWYYEYLVRKSPTKTAQETNLFRHYAASTAERDGYLYTFSASTLGKQWDKMGPFLEKSVASFRLLPPTESYVPPYKDPWRFW